MKQKLKRWIFGLLGKDPEGVIVIFRSGNPQLADKMSEEIRRLVADRRHFEVCEGSFFALWRRFRKYRIAQASVLFDGDPQFSALRRAAFFLAPRRILAYNSRLERHHLKLTSPIASWLFLRGVPLDRIFLRPRWLGQSANNRTERPTGHRMVEGRARNPVKRSVAVLSPYFPFPLSHGGAVRIFYLLREIAREFDVTLYAFTEEKTKNENLKPVIEFVTRVYLVRKPRYREPRWSTILPPEVGEYESPEMRRLVAGSDAEVLQTEYTALASYGGDVLVEHDITFDLYAQVRARRKGLNSWWDWWRWRRYEQRAISRFPRVVVMSEKDRAALGAPKVRVIENGVDLDRFRPEPERVGRKLLFIGSFRHFPNIVAYRFLTEEIMPNLPDVELTVVAGPDAWAHWVNRTGILRPPENPRIKILEFVADVRPLYVETNIVIVPTLESAGTNIKVLEALAMKRALVSTRSGCAGFGLVHGETAWIADDPAELARGVRTLLADDVMRRTLAARGRAYVEHRFDWRAIGARQRDLLWELIGGEVRIREGRAEDIEAIAAIQASAPEAAAWNAKDYLAYQTLVGVTDGKVVAFLAARETAPGEREILNVAVDPKYRRRGIAKRLVAAEVAQPNSQWFLEVRASNQAAIALYDNSGFRPIGRRENYYSSPDEAAIVMRFFS